MKIKKKKLQIAAILGMIFSTAIFAIAITYAFISNLSLFWIIFLVVIAMVEIISFWISVLFLINPKRKVFFIGLISLFAGLIPGIIILTLYFKTKRTLLKNFELNS
ncbi:MAG: hypothetical protein ACRC8P_02455 [Spiroplasma sp.]